nr:G patch domain-containing protein [Ipomoea batatas]GMC87717.1 G patch domain-containing protein [Ipomoea batatas]
MEGLIPYLLHAMKKQKSPHSRRHSFRCLSDTSNRSYHLLIGADSAEGSSHRRTFSDFQPDYFSDHQRSPRGLGCFPKNVTGAGSVMSPAASKHNNGTETAVTSGYQASAATVNVNHRR